MFIMMCSSFCSIVTCLFESILMPKSLMQECYKMLGADSYQVMSICHFCYIYWVLHIGMSSTCDLGYAMPYLQRCYPCIFVTCVVTRTSLQSSAFVNADFKDLGFHQVIFPAVIFLPSIHDATVRSMLGVSIFSRDDLDIQLCSIHPCPCFQLWSDMA